MTYTGREEAGLRLCLKGHIHPGYDKIAMQMPSVKQYFLIIHPSNITKITTPSPFGSEE